MKSKNHSIFQIPSESVNSPESINNLAVTQAYDKIPNPPSSTHQYIQICYPYRFQFPHSIRVINNNLGYQGRNNADAAVAAAADNHTKRFGVMQDVRIRVEQPNHGSPSAHRRPVHLFPQPNLK